MTEKELKKLNRYQLLELLIIQTKRADELQAQLDALQAEREQKELRLSRLGSIAEASLQVNGVFEAAQKAADQYIAAAEKRAAEIEAEARENAATMIEIARSKNFTIFKKETDT